MEPLHAMMVDFLGRLEGELLNRVSLARINAVLALGDPDLVLPSPAVALMQVGCGASVRPGPSLVFRSMQPLAPDGDVLLGLVDPDVVFHPWAVERATLVPPERGAPSSAMEPRRTSVLRVELRRSGDAACAPGWLSLHIEGGPALRWGVERAIVASGGQRLRARPHAPRPGTGALRPASQLVLHHLAALSSELLCVELSAELSAQARPVLDIHLEEGLDVSAIRPAVTANVFPVWNSVACRYPAFPEAERVVARNRGRLVHPLQPLGLGSSWRAWSVLRVGAAGEAGLVAGDRARSARTRSSARGGGYHLAYVPRAAFDGAPAGPGGHLVLAVVLSPAMAQELKRRDQRIAVDYHSTLGRGGNELPAGAEFQLIDTSGLPLRERVTGRLVRGSYGAADGLAGCAVSATNDELAAALPAASPRTVGHAAEALRLAFGADFELVDESDLVHRPAGNTLAPLYIRVRFSRARPAVERRTLLCAGQTFLEQYLDGQSVGRLLLVEQEDHHVA